MARQHGITTNTYKKFAIDQGAVYVDYGETGESLLGATRGGNTFTIEQDIREMEVDGAKGPVKGSKRITAVRAILVANFIEISPTILQLALPGSAVADYPDTPSKTHDAVTRALAIALTDYKDNVAIVGEVTGAAATSYIECIAKNPLANDNFEISFAPNDEGVITVRWVAHFTPDDLDTEPWEIRFPEIT